jgi:hypothetical protein
VPPPGSGSIVQVTEGLLDRLGFRPCPAVGKAAARLERPDRAVDHAPVTEIEADRVRRSVPTGVASVNHSTTSTGSVSADHVAAVSLSSLPSG